MARVKVISIAPPIPPPPITRSHLPNKEWHRQSSPELRSELSSQTPAPQIIGRFTFTFHLTPDPDRVYVRSEDPSPKKSVIGVREECRIREQDFGNFQITERMKIIKETRERFGRFFYRMPEGESAADVYDRVSSFLESLWRDIDMNRLKHDPSTDLNLIIVSHGLASRVFLMKWFKWTVEQFERLNNLNNCEFRILQLGPRGEYSLAVHHSDEEMQKWGLSPEMIADQKWRANATRGEGNEKCPWYLDVFFDDLGTESDDGDNSKDNTQIDS